MKSVVKLTIGLFLGILLTIGITRVHAQSGNVLFLGAVSGTTVSNCGTPTLPAECIVATGVYVCPNATGCSASTQWVLLPGSSTTTGVQKVNSTSPGATGNVTVGCTVAIPASTATFTAGSSTSATIPSQNITATCTGTGS